MQLRTFSATTTAEVMAQIKAELGSDAVIIDTQEERGVITMTAALERPLRANGSRGTVARGGNGTPDDLFGMAGMTLPQGDPQDWREEWGVIRNHLLALMKPALQLDQLAPRQRLALEFLQREGVNDEATLALFQELRKAPDISVLTPLGKIVPVCPWTPDNWPEQIHFFTGPFGAGKTTVAIRLALHLKKTNPDLRVCLINADATRGNGRLLLRHYCELSDLAYKEASTTMELVAAIAIAEREGFDKIFIDLPGLSRGKLLQALLADAGFSGSKQESAAVHLTMPPYYSEEEARTMALRYKHPFRGSLIWTKLDEAAHFGHIVNMGRFIKLPVSTLSYGPGLGNSLVPANANMLWRLLFKQELPDGN